MKKKILLLMTLATMGLTAATMAQVPNYVPTNGLVGYWPFNGNANDESGNGNNGTVNGATLTSDRFNSLNSCYLFTGTSNEISTTNQFFNNGWANYTISFWFNPSANLLNGCIINTTPHTMVLIKKSTIIKIQILVFILGIY